MTYKSERTIIVGTVPVLIRTGLHARLAVSISRGGDIIVRGPHTTTDTEAVTLVERRRSWIYQQLAHLTETAPDDPVKTLTTGTELDILGHPHRLHVVTESQQSEPLPRQQITATGRALLLHHSQAQNQDKGRRTLINFYANTGQDWLKEHLPQSIIYTANREIPATFPRASAPLGPATSPAASPFTGPQPSYHPSPSKNSSTAPSASTPSPATTTSTTHSAGSGRAASPPRSTGTRPPQPGRRPNLPNL
ncbi:YgjP-like metallopeptidase domain-containing protein [Streptomyces spectabilis]|uniref:YgjP-like metallopeptidase domain-containing protein n=1 Tax=Streptomyces spectabilis TaxID=68270 RepID=UPI0033C0A530